MKSKIKLTLIILMILTISIFTQSCSPGVYKPLIGAWEKGNKVWHFDDKGNFYIEWSGKKTSEGTYSVNKSGTFLTLHFTKDTKKWVDGEPELVDVDIIKKRTITVTETEIIGLAGRFVYTGGDTGTLEGEWKTDYTYTNPKYDKDSDENTPEVDYKRDSVIKYYFESGGKFKKVNDEYNITKDSDGKILNENDGENTYTGEWSYSDGILSLKFSGNENATEYYVCVVGKGFAFDKKDKHASLDEFKKSQIYTKKD